MSKAATPHKVSGAHGSSAGWQPADGLPLRKTPAIEEDRRDKQRVVRLRHTELCRLVVLAVVLAALAGGCGPAQPAPAKPGGLEIVNSDACSEQLHDLCAPLLLYYSVHKQLPARLADLGEVNGKPASSLVCPVSRKPYVYGPEGLLVPGWPGRLILYDAEPSHGGLRWGIQAEPPRPGRPVLFRVVRPPAAAFAGANFPRL